MNFIIRRLEKMKRKVILDCGTVGYWEEVDITYHYELMKQIKNEDEVKEFFKPGVFDGKHLSQYDGRHFIYGFMESFLQSDRCPTFLYDGNIKIQQIIVEEVKEKPSKVKCERCKHLELDFEDFPKFSYVCSKGKQDFKGINNIKEVEVECEDFESKYIEYPITVNGVKRPEGNGLRTDGRIKTGTLVKIRPCKEEYGNKTYLGIYLGEADLGLHVLLDNQTRMLNLVRHYNPAIFVPALKKVIYGCESWWGIIQSEEELKEITDEDIQNVWYVKLLREMENKKKEVHEG
jgi:hypothetical protein